MATVLDVSFTAADATGILSYTGEGGVTFARNGISTGSTENTIVSNRLTGGGGSGGVYEAYHTSVGASTANQTVSALCIYNNAATDNTGPMCRVIANSTFAVAGGYQIAIAPHAGGLRLRKHIPNSGPDNVNVVNVTLTNGVGYLLELNVSDSGANAVLTGYMQRNSDSNWFNGTTWQSGKTSALTYTDTTSPFMSAGRAGTMIYQDADQTTIDWLKLEDEAAGGPTQAPRSMQQFRLRSV